MFARSESAHQGVEIGVGQGDVRTPESRHHLDLCRYEIGNSKDDDSGKALETCFAKYFDFVIVDSDECGHPVVSPVGESTPETDRVGSQNLRFQFVSSHNQDGVGGDRNKPDARRPLARADNRWITR